MARCGYKTRVLGEEWECPLDALTGERYCYWHKEEDGKEPTEEQLEEMRRRGILRVYLPGAKLDGANFQEADLMGAKLSMANLRGANLVFAKLQGAELCGAKLQGANLHGVNLRGAKLDGANLQGVDLGGANFQGANLVFAKLQGAELSMANLRGATLSVAQLQGSDLHGARFDSKTYLSGSVLIGANLYHSYFDEAKSFRNARVFQNEKDGKEINEIAGDALGNRFNRKIEKITKKPVNLILNSIFHVFTRISKKKPPTPLLTQTCILAYGAIKKKAPNVAARLHENGTIRYVEVGSQIVFFDLLAGCVIQNPENGRLRERNLVRVEGLTDRIIEDGMVQSKFLPSNSHGAYLYEASYEVYNNLYNFYIANGKLDQAAHVHYRRGEAHRKLRWARGGLKNRTRSIFDLLILRALIGYGDRIGRPIFISGLIIGLFAALFRHFDGIVKNVNGTQVAPDWWDYFYHSITTFTSLGYSNIQPNLASGHLPQVLVAAESGLGILMTALIIFVVTYQVSR